MFVTNFNKNLETIFLIDFDKKYQITSIFIHGKTVFVDYCNMINGSCGMFSYNINTIQQLRAY